MQLRPGDKITISDMGERDPGGVIVNPELDSMGCIRVKRNDGKMCSVHFSRVERLNGSSFSTSDILKAADKSMNPNLAFRKFRCDELRRERIQKGRRTSHTVRKRMV